MNLALFPITALLLLLSGVGAPAHPGDNRAATALIKALLGEAGASAAPGRRLAFAEEQAAHRPASRLWISTSQSSYPRVRASISPCLRRHGNQKAYRTRFGFAEGAYQPQGPPRPSARA